MKIFKLNYRIVLVVMLLMPVLGNQLFGQSINSPLKQAYVPNVLLAKLKPQHRTFFSHSSALADERIAAIILSIEPTFPNKVALPMMRGTAQQQLVDLSLVHTINIASNGNLQLVLSVLKKLDVFEYVEQKRYRYITATANDPFLGNQSYLSQINAFSAWDQTTGNAAIKIGVVDTGTDTDHPDLVTEEWENTLDPINGIDDDNDGYIDNFRGWDFVDNDNDPQVQSSDHGAHVSGIAAAATNNNEGVASVGYATKFVPIRVGNGSLIEYGYEGIVYAADLGCDIINCSWGGFGSSQFEEDVINYATYNHDALVVCASGNQNRDQSYYPAAYENALAVSSVNSADAKSSFTNQGYWVDIAAPGESIYATVDDGQYNYNTGTSMATPVVSGAAALVKAKYPQLSALQIAAQLKANSVNIDGINTGFEHKLGVGRLNVGASVGASILGAYVEFGNAVITNATDNVFKGNDSLFISGTFTNYLATSGNVTATFSSNSPYVSINNANLTLGVMGSTLQIANFSTPFSAKILQNAPLNEEVVFQITVTDGSFTTTFFVPVVVNVDYLNVAVNNISTSVGSKGQFGYNTTDQSQGLGVQLNNALSQLYEGGIMIGSNTSGVIKVADKIRNGGSASDNDFSSILNVSEVVPSPIDDYYITGVFNDANTFADSMGITITHHAYAFTDVGHENYVVVEYVIENKSNSTLNNVYAGLFADFDVEPFNKNKVLTDAQRFMTYTSSTENNQSVFGVQLLTSTSFFSHGLDNLSGGNGGVDIFNNFSSTDKFQTLSENRYNAGFGSSSGNDVIQVTSTGGLSLAPGDSIKVAFAILAAEHITILEQVADSAYFRYNGSLPNSIQEVHTLKGGIKVYPNPVSQEAVLNVEDAFLSGNYEVKILDLAGKQVHPTIVANGDADIKIVLSYLKSGMYIVQVVTSKETLVTKLIKK